MSNKTPKLEMKDVHKFFGKNHVLNGINLQIQPGESMVILGGSGSGKSVMLKHMIGLIEPTSGSIKIDGVETANIGTGRERDAFIARFGMLFQGGALFDSLPVWENVAFGLIARKMMNRKDAHDVALEKLAAVGLGRSVAELFPAELSGGMQKRVSLARAIATNPEIIFFDEPTTGLDPIMADVINELIIRCTKELGATTVSITHDMRSAKRIGDRAAMIYQGQIIWVGDMKDLYDSGNPYVDQFINGRAEGPIDGSLSHA